MADGEGAAGVMRVGQPGAPGVGVGVAHVRLGGQPPRNQGQQLRARMRTITLRISTRTLLQALIFALVMYQVGARGGQLRGVSGDEGGALQPAVARCSNFRAVPGTQLPTRWCLTGRHWSTGSSWVPGAGTALTVMVTLVVVGLAGQPAQHIWLTKPAPRFPARSTSPGTAWPSSWRARGCCS
jgi:hypothetical protein